MAKIQSKNYLKILVNCQIAMLLIGGFLATPVKAVDPLVISGVATSIAGKAATISWNTNRSAAGRVTYGLTSNSYGWTIGTNQSQASQAITIQNLAADTTYYFKIIAVDQSTEVTSFEQNFKTPKNTNNQAPILSKVKVVYASGKTATIQWLTDEPATSEIEYGKTEKYGSNRADGALTTIHDLTISGLQDGTFYHFLVKSKDEDKNVSRWYDMTFQTLLTDASDKTNLAIDAVTPTSENNLNVTKNSAVISWHTNKLAEGLVRYGTSNTSYNKTIKTTLPRDFFQNITLTGLTAGTTYYFEIEARDVTGKTIKSGGHSFITRSDSQQIPEASQTMLALGDTNGQVLGAASCDINLQNDFGFYGLYYNLPENHPDIRTSAVESWSKIGRENDWYNSQYFAFSRVDKNLNFGAGFFPVNQGKPGDPHYFAVNWRAIIEVPKTDNYSYTVTADDDAWIFVDDQLTVNLGGVHSSKTEAKSIYLTAGYHKLEIFYADRAKRTANFTFLPSGNLIFHPLPDGCEIDDVLSQNGLGGKVLGASNIDTRNDNYVCNPNLGYTRFKALYKTAASPDVWAILETGQKHYITSPEALAKYECDWSDVKIVSQKVLNSYDSARLVRTPEDSTIYYLFQRPEVQWLKINIPSPTVFVSYPNNYWGNVARVDALDIEAYPNIELIKSANSDTIYLIDDTTKRPFSSGEMIKELGYNPAEAAILSSAHMESYQDGAAVE